MTEWEAAAVAVPGIVLTVLSVSCCSQSRMMDSDDEWNLDYDDEEVVRPRELPKGSLFVHSYYILIVFELSTYLLNVFENINLFYTFIAHSDQFFYY